MMMRMTAPPAAPKGLVTINFHIAVRVRVQVEGIGASTSCGCRVAMAMSISLTIAYPGIEPGINQVDNQIDKDKTKGDEQNQRLYHRNIPMRNGVNDKAPHTIQGEDRFRDDQPANEKSKFRPKNGDHR